MSIETIVQSWKSDEDNVEIMPNPVGKELSDQDLAEVAGAEMSISTTITITTTITTVTTFTA